MDSGGKMLVVKPGAIDRIRQVLIEAGFTENGVVRHLDSEDSVRFEPREIPRLLRQTSGGTPLDCFIRLFLLGMSIPVPRLEEAVSPMPVSAWQDAGLIEIRDGFAEAPLKLVPSANYLVAFDPSTRHLDREPREDHVHGIGSATVNLINATIRRDVHKTLDLGTGCGIQGLLCAGHSRRVVSTDINPRALNIAAFNAALNGIDNIEFRTGSLFEPVAGETFDLITMNPPFAISPDNRFIFRDGGMADDGFVRTILETAPGYLNQGGICQITAQWAHVTGQDWRDRIAGWVSGSGCDVWVLNMKTQSSQTYVANWITETEKHTPESYRERWESWMTYLDDRNITAVSTGIVCMRRNENGRHWFVAHEDADRIDEQAGEAIHRIFVLQDYLRGRSDADLLKQSFEMNQDLMLEQISRPTDGSEGASLTLEKSVLRVTRGIHYAGNIDPLIIGLIGRCGSGKPLGELIRSLARTLNTEEANIRDSVLAIVRNLIERGFLLPVGETGG